MKEVEMNSKGARAKAAGCRGARDGPNTERGPTKMVQTVGGGVGRGIYRGGGCERRSERRRRMETVGIDRLVRAGGRILKTWKERE